MDADIFILKDVSSLFRVLAQIFGPGRAEREVERYKDELEKALARLGYRAAVLDSVAAAADRAWVVGIGLDLDEEAEQQVLRLEEEVFMNWVKTITIGEEEDGGERRAVVGRAEGDSRPFA